MQSDVAQDQFAQLHWDILIQIMARVSADDHLMIHRSLLALTQLGIRSGLTGIPVSTACSGTDCPILNFCKLQVFYPGVVFDQRFQCEYDGDKQRWLAAMIPECPVMYNDITRLGGKLALNLSLILRRWPPSSLC